MFKKLIALTLISSIFLGQAQASSNNNLKSIFDELTYSMEVEWDQKDESFKAEKLNNFNSQVAVLLNQGLTNEELISFVNSEIRDEQFSKDLRMAMEQTSLNKMTKEEADLFLQKSLEKAYAKGASWSGEISYLGVVAIMAGVFGLIVLILAIDKTIKAEKVRSKCEDGVWSYPFGVETLTYTCNGVTKVITY